MVHRCDGWGTGFVGLVKFYFIRKWADSSEYIYNIQCHVIMSPCPYATILCGMQYAIVF